MKKKSFILTVIRTLFAFLLTVGSQTFLQPCVHEDGNFGTCHWAGQVVTCLSLLFLIISLLSLMGKLEKEKKGLALASALLAALCLFVPGYVIPLCMMNTMRCNLIMAPSVRICAGLLILLSILEWMMLDKEEKK